MLFSVLLLAAITWPPGAQIIERAPVPSPKGPRELVLWMTNPVRDGDRSDAYCGDRVHGDFFKGPSHLSLTDPVAGRILNTIKLDDDLPIPYLVSNELWRIPQPDIKGRGKPQILNLRDLTGEGDKSQFVLFRYSACGIADTSVAGYSAKSDRAVHYPIHRRNEVSRWAMTLFARQPIRPGHWDFVWTPAHGTFDHIREHVDFDAARQVFIHDPELVPTPGLPNFLPPGARIIEQQLIDFQYLLVLWIDRPRYWDPPPEARAAIDILYGPHWTGPAHLSLVDPATNRVTNTLDLPKGIPIPAAGYYAYGKHRRPVLDMHDLTGEGLKGQFSFLEYLNSSTNDTRAYGYSPAKKRVVQYLILSQGKLELSIPVIFQQPQTVPGLWKFIHQGDHGDDRTYDERVIFDRTRQIFVRQVRITPQSAPPPRPRPK